MRPGPGSLPAGFLAGRLKGVDIRTVGSGNIGATNAFRMLGKGIGTAVLLIDLLKGLLPCLFFAELVAASVCWVATVAGAIEPRGLADRPGLLVGTR